MGTHQRGRSRRITNGVRHGLVNHDQAAPQTLRNNCIQLPHKGLQTSHIESGVSAFQAAFRETIAAVVNVPSSEQSHLAMNFATKRETEKFTEMDWYIDSDVPRLPGAVGFVGCEVAAIAEGGGHVVLLGDVRVAGGGDRLPLTYHNRAFATYVAMAAQRS